jgi:ATP/maltotriose-dependent transcriptional regulator MalT
MDLLERDHALDTMRQRLHDAAESHGWLLLVGGEAGVGKTTLLRHFIEDARVSAHVMIGHCDALSTPRPLGPLFDVASSDLALNRLLLDNSPRELLFRMVLNRLSGSRNPVILVIEDAHWADEATLDLLRYLGRRIEATRSLLIVSYRDDEIGPRHPFRRLLGDLAAVPAVQRLPVLPLTHQGVADLAMGSGVDPRELYARTRGNPFFVTAVLANDGAMPPTVQDAVLARTSRLSARACSVLEAAAIIGSPIDLGLLEAVAGPAINEFDACLQTGILQYQGTSLVFRHEIAREAILSAITPARRAALHAAVLGVLEARPSNLHDPARLAHHAEEARDDAAVLRHAPEAARRAALLRAHREAAKQYERALGFAASLPKEEVARLLEARAHACYFTAQIDQAIAARAEALGIWVGLGNQCKEGENRSHLANLYWAQARISDAEREAEAAVALLEQSHAGPELAMAYGTLARLRGPTSNYYEAIRLGQQAMALAEKYGSTETYIDALMSVGEAKLARGAVESGQQQVELGMHLAREAGLEELTARAYICLGHGFAESGQPSIATQHFERGIRYCAERDLDLPLLHMTALLAECRIRSGDWDDALALSRSVLHATDVAPSSKFVALLVTALIQTRKGEPGAGPLLEEGLTLANANRSIHFLAPIQAIRAEASFLAGQLDQTLADARAAFDRAVDHGHPRYRGELAYWRWQGGEFSEPPSGIPAPFALQITGDWEAAARAWEDLGRPYEAARALAEGNDEKALRAALATFERLGAKPAAALVRGRLRGLGARGISRGPRPSTRANVGGLTAREVDVLALVARGYSNQKIAECLFLSSRTIENHIAAILSKLGAATRAEAAARAEQLEIIP